MTVAYHRETHHCKCLKCLLLALRHAIKQSPLINRLINEALLVADHISIRCHCSSWTYKHVPAFRFQSVSPGAGALVSFSCSQRWKWMMQDYYCDVLLLKQLLSYISQAAGDFYFPVHHACTRAQSCCDTRFRTSHQAWPPNRPDLNLVDYGICTVIQECIYQKHHVSSYITDKLWLLTEWHIIFHKVG